MAILIKTSNPGILLRRIRKAHQEGSISTWQMLDEKRFSLVGEWNQSAWLIPYIDTRNKQLTFGIRFAETGDLRTIYGVYHGRFSELLLIHFFEWIELLEQTTYPLFPEDQLTEAETEAFGL